MSEPNAILAYCERERARFRGQTFPNKRAELRLAEIAVIEAAREWRESNWDVRPAYEQMLRDALAAFERSLPK